MATAKRTPARHVLSIIDARVHLDGPALVGWHTLCGEVDQAGAKFERTAASVNCPSCIDVIAHVESRKPKRSTTPRSTR